jgi:predicted ABC-type exoprotein transport system permease subunit
MAPSLVWLLVIWSVLTAVLVVLLIYRSTLTMQEDDQLFLGEAEAHMEKEQADLMRRVDRITPYVQWLGASSVVLILIIAAIAVYGQMTRPAF